MYDAATRETYAQLFKLAEANPPASLREKTIKIASTSGSELVAAFLKSSWGTP